MSALDSVDPGAGSSQQASGRPVTPAGMATVKGPGIMLRVVVVGLVMAALLVALTHIYREQQTLAGALALIQAQQQESVQSLETRVASTTTTMKSKDSETQKSLNTLVADIRRLDVALGKLTQQVGSQGHDIGRQESDLRKLAGELRSLVQASAQADLRLRELVTDVEQQAARQKGLADAITRLERSTDAAQLRAEVAVLGASLREGQQEHERRIKATEQAIASNDAFRRQVNATIDRLAQQLNELYPRR